MNNIYTTLHNHSDYSSALLGFADSIMNIEEAIQYAYDIGLNGFSITNHEGISDHLIAEKYYDSMKKDRPFKLIRGNEIYLLTEEENYNNQNYLESTPFYHALLQAKDLEGHKQIRKLSSKAWYDSYFKKGIVRKPTFYSSIEKEVKENPNHLIFQSACIGSLLGQEILNWKLFDKENEDKHKKKIHSFITWALDLFGEDFYLEIQPCLEDNEEQRIVNKTIVYLSQVYKIKVVVTTDSHYLNKENQFIHTTLMKAQEGERESEKFYATTYIMTPKELTDFLLMDFTIEEIEKFFDNTNEIAEKCEDYSLKQTSDVPLIPENKLSDCEPQHCFKEFYEVYPNIKKYATSENKYDKHFWKRLELGLQNKVINNKKRTATLEQYLKRVNDEIADLIILSEALQTNMACYYTTVEKVIELIYEVDSLVGTGRGSAGAWCIAYLLDITLCDSVEVPELQFHQRHLSAGRKTELPDCDIDVCASKRQQIIEVITNYWGQEHVSSVGTFTTMSGRSAIDKACKGLEISDDTAGFLKSLIPFERGKLYSLQDCFFGNEKLDRKPVKEFIKEINKYENLQTCVLAFEGMVINRSSHAGGLIISNKPIVDYNAVMRTANGLLITQFDLHDAEECGIVKFDLLSLAALDMIKTTMGYLIKFNHIKDQGSLRKTFNHYLNPDVINYDNKEMWNTINQCKSLFQYESVMGKKAIKNMKPMNIHDLTTANSIMRLKGNDNIVPMDLFIKYKNNIDLWYQDMKEFGLNQEEIDIMKEYLSVSYGICESQEKLIKLTMDKRISGFDLRESDQARKAVAKASKKALKDTEERLYSYGEKIGSRKVFLDYLWNVQFEMQKAYAFSEIHSYEYSVIALQQMNLNYFYPSVYWNCACLSVDAFVTEDDQQREKNAIDYGKICRAIYTTLKFNIEVMPPSINKSEISFTPIEEENIILFGLGSISSINHEIAKEIIQNRPYNNFTDFLNKTTQPPSKVIQLIKAGCFDEFTQDRKSIIEQYIKTIIEPKESLNGQNLPKCIELDIKDLSIRPYKFKQYVINQDFLYCQDPNFKSKKHYIVEPKFALPYLQKHYLGKMQEGKDYYYENDNLIVVDKSLEKAMKKDLDLLKEQLNSPEIIKEFNQKMFESEYQRRVKTDDINKWSFEATSYYHNKQHELSDIDYDKYVLNHFSTLPEDPVFIQKGYKTRKWREYQLSRICGTCIDRNDTKNTIDLLTPDLEVVTIKFYSGHYSWYKQVFSHYEGEDKIIDDDSWFKRGTLLMISGYRNGENFHAKRYKNSIYQHTVVKISEVKSDGNLILQYERESENETQI